MKLQGLFITPVFTAQLENNYDIEQKLYDLKSTDTKNNTKSNIGGWHSHEDLYQEKEFKQITGDILVHAKECFAALNVEDKYHPEMTGFWGMINPPGARNLVHTHPFNFFCSGRSIWIIYISLHGFFRFVFFTCIYICYSCFCFNIIFWNHSSVL